MRALLERQFSADARQLRSRLIKLWLFFPILIFGEALLTLRLNELSAVCAIITLAFCLPYYFLTGVFFCRVWQSCCLKSPRRFARVFLTLSTVVTVAGWAYLNSRSRHNSLADGVNDHSPFGQPWYYWDQSHYGYPSPFLRFFDRPLEGYGDRIFDASSLFGNFQFLSFGIFILATVTSLIWKPKK